MPGHKRPRRHGNPQKLQHLINKLHWAVKEFWALAQEEQHSQLKKCAQALHVSPTGVRLRFLHLNEQLQVVTDFTQLTQHLEMLIEDEVKEGEWLPCFTWPKRLATTSTPGNALLGIEEWR